MGGTGLLGGVVITVYFGAGGLLTAASVNVVQLTVKLLGFAVALTGLTGELAGDVARRVVRTTTGGGEDRHGREDEQRDDGDDEHDHDG